MEVLEIAIYSLVAFYAFFALISIIRLYKILIEKSIYRISIAFYIGMLVTSICRGITLLFITQKPQLTKATDYDIIYFLLITPDMVYLCVYLILVWHFLKYFIVSHINTANDLNIFVKEESEMKNKTNFVLTVITTLYIITFITIALLQKLGILSNDHLVKINSSFNIITPLLFLAFDLFLTIKFSGRPYINLDKKNETKDILIVTLVWSAARIMIGILELIFFNDEIFKIIQFINDGKPTETIETLYLILCIVYFIVTEFIPDYFVLDYNLMKTFIIKSPIEVIVNDGEVDSDYLMNQTLYKKDVQTMKIPFIQFTLQSDIYSRRHGLGKLLKAVYKGKEVACRQISFERFNRYNLEEVFKDIEKVMELQNSYICPIIGICDDDNPNLYIIYPYYKSKSLYDVLHIDKITIPFYKTIGIALSIAKGIQYLHEKDIYHCHLSSRNIYFDEDFQPKIGDYGFDNLKDIANKFCKYSNKNSYSPPELLNDANCFSFRINKDELTEKVDIYSFGILLWELVTNTIPFDVKLNDLYAYVVEQNMRPEIQKNVDMTITNLIRACWDTDPKKRPNIKEVIDKLNEKYILITCSSNKDS